MVSSAVPVDGLLEREVALARFDRVFDRVGVGAGAVVVVQGAAGIGKSELLAAVRTRAQARGSAALSARGSEFEEEIAFGVARQLFEPMLRAASPGDRRRLLDGVAQVGARALGIEAGEPPADRFAAIHGLYWLCANRAERGPLVVVVDDVQLVDDPSLAWLGYLARRTEDLPLMLVLGLRSGDPGGERGELEGLLRDRGVERIDLKPLSAAAVGVLVRARLDHSADEDFCGACYDLTHGNPLSAVELLAAVREQGLAARGESVPALHRIAPAAVGTSVLARLGRLGDEAVALARAVAVLGRGAETAIAAALAGIDPAVAELTADRLASAQIFASVRPLEFSHPLIAAAVSNDRAPGALRVAHRRAAELLHRGGHASHALVSAHLLLCAPGDDGWVVEVLRAAAREAGASGSPETAVSYLERGLKEEAPAVVRAALLFELGAAQLLAGRAGATQRMREALELSTDHRRRAEISLALGRALLATGDAAALDAFGRGLAELAENDDDELSIELQGWSTTSSYAHDESALSPPVRARLGALLAGDARASTRPERFLLAHAAFRSAISGDRPHDQVARLASRALADGALLADSGGDVGTHGAACYALLFAGEPDLAIAELNRAIAWSRRRAVPVAFRRFSLMRGIANYMRGEIGAALGDLASADGGYEEGFTRDFPAARAYRALCLIERDDLAGASDALAVSAAEEPLLRQGNRVSYVYALARLRSAHGELREALETVRECDELVRERGARNPAATLSWRSEAALLELWQHLSTWRSVFRFRPARCGSGGAT